MESGGKAFKIRTGDLVSSVIHKVASAGLYLVYGEVRDACLSNIYLDNVPLGPACPGVAFTNQVYLFDCNFRFHDPQDTVDGTGLGGAFYDVIIALPMAQTPAFNSMAENDSTVPSTSSWHFEAASFGPGKHRVI